MQKRFKHFLNRPFPLFLWNDKGRNYYYWMIFFFVVLANITKPFGFVNWLEYHRSLVLTIFICLFFGMYALLHHLLKIIHPRNYDKDTWTLKKEFMVLMFFFPAITGSSCLYAQLAVPEFELTMDTFLDILLYNGTLSFLSVPTFGFFIDKKLIPSQPKPLIILPRAIEPKKPIELPKSIESKEKTKSNSQSHLTEEQALKILQKLKELMETQQLYLSHKCNLQYVADRSGIPRHRISDSINNFSDDNFHDFVNRYRVEHACRLLKNGQGQHLKVEAIVCECGFESRSSFFNTFKKFTGKTTSEYLDELGIAPNP